MNRLFIKQNLAFAAKVSLMSNEIESEDPPKIDIAHLRRMAGDDESLMLEVLGLFREQGEVWQRLLDPDNETKDWMVGAHTIKGSARGIGAWELGEICAKAEEAATNSQLSRDEKYIWREQIIGAFDAAIYEVAHIEHKLLLRTLSS